MFPKTPAWAHRTSMTSKAISAKCKELYGVTVWYDYLTVHVYYIMLNNAGMFSLYNSMLHVVQQINHCNVCLQGLRLLYKAPNTWKTGQADARTRYCWLICPWWVASVSRPKFISTVPIRPRNSRVFVFSIWYVWATPWQKHCSDFRW